MTAAARLHASPTLLLPPKGDPARPWALALLCVMPLAIGALALLLGADASWDLRNYHWYNAWAYLNGRQQADFMPSQSQFFLNPWLDVPFFWLATHAPLKIAFFLLGTVQGLNFPLLFMIAYASLALQDMGRKVAAAAGLAAAGTFSAIGISEIGTVFYDNITSLGVLSSLLLILRLLTPLQEMPERQAARYAFLSGLPAGIVAGLKLTSASYSVGLCLALLIFSPNMRRCFILSFCFGLGVLAGFLAAYGHWGWYLAIHYGSPTFPFFNIIFHAPLLPKDSLLLDFAPPHDWRLLVYPFLFDVNPKLVNEIWWQDWRIPALYALFLWLLVQYKGTKRRAHGGKLMQEGPERFLLLWGAISYYCWALSETVYRYLMPLDLLAPLLIAACIGLLPFARRARIIAAVAVVAALSLTIQPGHWGRHASWPESMTAVKLPKLSEKPDTLVLMTSDDAFAYLLPALPPEFTYLRLQNRGFPLKEYPAFTALLRAKIAAHKGPFALLVPSREMHDAAIIVRFFHLAIAPESCKTITDKLAEAALDHPQDEKNNYPADYSFCDVTHLR